MASTSEVGYAKQLAEFEDFITLLTALGTVYNPPKPQLALTNLQDQLTAGKSTRREISMAIPTYSMAIDKQNLAFKFLNDKITKSLNFYKACLSNPDEIDTAKNLADKIRGFGKKKKVGADVTPPETEIKSISQAQMSYDSRIENLKQYIDVLTASGVYTNPGNGIDINDLTTLLTEMKSTNNTVMETKMPLDVARNKRDLILYAPETGIAELAANIKPYLKATLPKDNHYYDALLGFTFRKRY